MRGRQAFPWSEEPDKFLLSKLERAGKIANSETCLLENDLLCRRGVPHRFLDDIVSAVFLEPASHRQTTKAGVKPVHTWLRWSPEDQGRSSPQLLPYDADIAFASFLESVSQGSSASATPAATTSAPAPAASGEPVVDAPSSRVSPSQICIPQPVAIKKRLRDIEPMHQALMKRLETATGFAWTVETAQSWKELGEKMTAAKAAKKLSQE
jgi:hypothetical protein